MPIRPPTGPRWCWRSMPSSTVAGPSGSRTIAATDFFKWIDADQRWQSGEILARYQCSGNKQRRRLREDRAEGQRIRAVRRGGGCRCRRRDRVAVAITGVSAIPFRAREVERALQNGALTAERIASAAGSAAAGVQMLATCTAPQATARTSRASTRAGPSSARSRIPDPWSNRRARISDSRRHEIRVYTARFRIPTSCAYASKAARTYRSRARRVRQRNCGSGLGAIRGRYTGRARVRDAHPPDSFTLTVEGKGPEATSGAKRV